MICVSLAKQPHGFCDVQKLALFMTKCAHGILTFTALLKRQNSVVIRSLSYHRRSNGGLGSWAQMSLFRTKPRPEHGMKSKRSLLIFWPARTRMRFEWRARCTYMHLDRVGKGPEGRQVPTSAYLPLHTCGCVVTVEIRTADGISVHITVVESRLVITHLAPIKNRLQFLCCGLCSKQEAPVRRGRSGMTIRTAGREGPYLALLWRLFPLGHWLS